MRLDRFLANTGHGSRTEVKQLIKKGSVTIDSSIVKKADTKFNPEQQIVAVNGDVIHYEPLIYIMLNKPAGVISATEDSLHRTVIDLVPDYQYYDLHPVGRLDKDTEGLLILTNDGQFSHDVLSPRKHVNKTYYAEINGVVTAETVSQFKAGLTLDDGYETMPAQLTILSSADTSHIEVVIQEGKFHQVKRMFEAVGMTVSYLKRVKMGSLALDPSLDYGQYRKLTAQEVNLVKN